MREKRKVQRGDPATGKRIRQARRLANLTVAQAAAAIGVAPGFFYAMESGWRLVPIARWHRLVELLPTLTLDELARGASEAGPVEIDPRCLTPRTRAIFLVVLAENAERVHLLATAHEDAA